MLKITNLKAHEARSTFFDNISTFTVQCDNCPTNQSRR
jgi:hypothetical protein